MKLIHSQKMTKIKKQRIITKMKSKKVIMKIKIIKMIMLINQSLVQIYQIVKKYYEQWFYSNVYKIMLIKFFYSYIFIIKQ